MARRELQRASEVINALAKQGLGYFIQEYGLKWHLPFHKKIKSYSQKEGIPERLRKSMEELGGAYVKLGQLLSLRPDLVPQEYCDEFRKLLDKMPAFSYTQAKKIIEKELNAPMDSVFKEFDKKPIGSASISQVHTAKLKNGKKVVVKVQRPNAEKQFESDIKIMYYLAQKVEKYFKDRVSPISIVQEFERYTKNELNFLTEARNICRFYDIFKNTKKVIVPNAYMQHSTSKVLVMDYIHGAKLSEIDIQYSRKIRQEIVKEIANAVFKMIADKGFFHADLHPGNIMILPGRAIGLLDFGIVGRLDKELKRQAMDMLVALVNKDSKEAVKVLLKTGTPTAETNIEQFEAEIESIIHRWHGTELREARVTRMMHNMFNSCMKHHIKMPTDLVLLGKAMVTAEATCMQLNPEFNLVEYAKPQIAKVLKKERRPSAVIKRFLEKSKDLSETLYELPEKTVELVNKFKREPIKLDLDDVDIWHLGRDINYSSNRLSYAIVIAALLVSAAMLINIRPQMWGYSLFSITAVLIAGILMIVLLTSIMREGLLPYGPRKKFKR